MLNFKNITLKLINFILIILIGSLLFYCSNKIMKNSIKLTSANSYLYSITWYEWMINTSFLCIFAYPLFIFIRFITRKKNNIILQSILGLGIYFFAIIIIYFLSYFSSLNDQYVIKNILIFSFLGFLTPFIEYSITKIFDGKQN